jgi:hypothetical protein
MSAHDAIHFLETWISKIFLLLGGFAGMTKIIEWFLNRPKIIGEIENTTVASLHSNKDNSFIASMLLLHLYIVNKRAMPTTIRNWEAYVKVEGEWIKGEIHIIPNDFTLPGLGKIDFKNSRIYETSFNNLLEYGKGMRGWLQVQFPTLTQEKIGQTDIRVIAIDAFGGSHRITLKKEKRRRIDKIGYFPGSGMSHR